MRTLNQLISEAYILFSSYKMGKEFAVCTYCCLPEKDQKILVSTTLKELPAPNIYQYLDAASDESVLLIKQMRYLLPRILELLIANQNIRHSNEITLDKLYCKNPIWQKKELAFLERFAEHYFDYVLNTGIPNKSSKIELMEIIIMFDKAGLNVTNQLLSMLLENAHKTSVISEVVNIYTYDIKNNGEYSQAFADRALINKITHWLTSKTVKETFLQVILLRVDSKRLQEKERFLFECAFNILTSL